MVIELLSIESVRVKGHLSLSGSFMNIHDTFAEYILDNENPKGQTINQYYNVWYYKVYSRKLMNR